MLCLSYMIYEFVARSPPSRLRPNSARRVTEILARKKRPRRGQKIPITCTTHLIDRKLLTNITNVGWILSVEAVDPVLLSKTLGLSPRNEDRP
jgi:hypothetical protein